MYEYWCRNVALPNIYKGFEITQNHFYPGIQQRQISLSSVLCLQSNQETGDLSLAIFTNQIELLYVGKLIVNILPSPNFDSTLTLPPIPSTRVLTIDKPKPQPPVL